MEEAEGLLRGWPDRAAANKVAQLVADLVGELAASNRQKAALKQRLEAQTRDHNHTVATLQTQIIASTQHSKVSTAIVLGNNHETSATKNFKG